MRCDQFVDVLERFQLSPGSGDMRFDRWGGQRVEHRRCFLVHRPTQHCHRPIHEHMSRPSLRHSTAGGHDGYEHSAGVEARGPVLRANAQCVKHFGGRGITERGDTVDVGSGEPCVFNRGANGLQRQVQARDACATSDSRDAEAADDRVLLEVAHRAPESLFL